MVDFYKYKSFLFTAICSVLVFTVVFASINLTINADNIKVYLPILMYHHVLDDASRQNKYTVSSAEFEQDLKYIEKNGYTTVSAKQLTDFAENKKPLPKKPILLTFDDGYESVYAYAYPLLKKYKMKAVINVIGRYAELYSNTNDHSIAYSHITWKQLSEITENGVFEVGNHTYNMHVVSGRRGIAKKSGESLQQYQAAIGTDIGKMQLVAKEKLNIIPIAFAYPFGSISKEALPVIKQQGIKMVFCCWEKVNVLTQNSEELYHLNRFNRPHGVSTEKFFAKIEKEII